MVECRKALRIVDPVIGAGLLGPHEHLVILERSPTNLRRGRHAELIDTRINSVHVQGSQSRTTQP
jgi:hypothetical protein